MRSVVGDLLADLAAVLDSLGVRWYLFGAQAALVHGAARLTADVDVTALLPGTLSAASLAETLAGAGFEARIPDPGFVARTRVLPVLHAATEVPLDIVLGGPGFEEHVARRAARHDIEGVPVPVATAEDLVVMKVLAGRPKDMDDVVAVLAAQASSMDLEYVRDTVAALEAALGQSDLMPALERALALARGPE
jgi:hypothetical protein